MEVCMKLLRQHQYHIRLYLNHPNFLDLVIMTLLYQKEITANNEINKIIEEVMLNGSIAMIAQTNKLEINRISKFLLMDLG